MKTLTNVLNVVDTEYKYHAYFHETIYISLKTYSVKKRMKTHVIRMVQTHDGKCTRPGAHRNYVGKSNYSKGKKTTLHIKALKH